MNSIGSLGGIAASVSLSSLSFSSHQASNVSSRVFENDKFSFSTQGTQDVTLQNKHSGDTHQASGDFGQSQLDGCFHDHQGCGNGAIDKIVKQVIEAVCKELGIDPSEIFGQQPSQEDPPPCDGGFGSQKPSSPWDRPACDGPQGGGSPIFNINIYNNGPTQAAPAPAPAAPQDDTPISLVPNPLGLGSLQNQKDHNPIELALDPLGFF